MCMSALPTCMLSPIFNLKHVSCLLLNYIFIHFKHVIFKAFSHSGSCSFFDNVNPLKYQVFDFDDAHFICYCLFFFAYYF